MIDVLGVLALGWGLWMTFRKYADGSNLGRWIGVATVVGVIVVEAIIYVMTHEHGVRFSD
jgi:hypothetical protein